LPRVPDYNIELRLIVNRLQQVADLGG
jgi:hypothetical protein